MSGLGEAVMVVNTGSRPFLSTDLNLLGDWSIGIFGTTSKFLVLAANISLPTRTNTREYRRTNPTISPVV